MLSMDQRAQDAEWYPGTCCSVHSGVHSMGHPPLTHPESLIPGPMAKSQKPRVWSWLCL